jgi:hypothetical protein
MSPPLLEITRIAKVGGALSEWEQGTGLPPVSIAQRSRPDNQTTRRDASFGAEDRGGGMSMILTPEPIRQYSLQAQANWDRAQTRLKQGPA